MKSIIAVALVGFVATVSAQAPSLSDFPQCALPCLLNGLQGTSCGATDFKCACSDTTYISKSKVCIDAACPAADQQKALLVTQAMCSGAGVPIAIPSGTAASSASSSAASSSAASSSAAATLTATSPSAASSIPTAAASGNATTVVPSTSNNGTLASPTPTSNAASRLGAMSGVVALGLGIAAFAI